MAEDDAVADVMDRWIQHFMAKIMRELERLVAEHKKETGKYPDFCWATLEEEVSESGSLAYVAHCAVGPEAPADAAVHYNCGWLNWRDEQIAAGRSPEDIMADDYRTFVGEEDG